MIYENVSIEDIDSKLKLLNIQNEKISKEIEELNFVKKLKKNEENKIKQEEKKIKELNLFDDQINYTYQKINTNDLENSSLEITIIDNFTNYDYDIESTFDDDYNIESIFELRNFKKSKVKFKHGDILDITQHRHYSWKFLNKDGKLQITTRPNSLDHEYGVTAPIQITNRYEDALKKFSSIEEITVIEVSYYDKSLKNYEIPDDNNHIFEFRLDFENDNGWELYSIDKYNNEKICKLKSNDETKQISYKNFINKNVVFTGKRDNELIKITKEKSILIGSSVTKNTYAVITDDIDSSTEKIKKAEKLNIPIYTIEKFYKILSN